ncbi:MAG: hypothetical protein RMJ13_04685 [Elusimicrobiota bacterium]|nr:hypothetical protein [Elusimicrobiota bacterium]
MNKLFFYVLALSFFCNIFSLIPIFGDELILEAESVSYDRKNNKVYGDKNVRIKYKNLLLETDSLIYDLDLNKIFISTDCFLTFSENRLFAKNLEYDVNTEQIVIKDFYGFYSPYYSYSSICVVKEEVQVLSDAKVTHCNLKQPHYYFKSKKVIVYPKERIKLESPSLVVRSFPVLWLPYYEVSLKPRQDYFILEPSYENERGIIIKAKYGRKISDSTDLAIITDSSSRRLGLGSEFKYKYDKHNGIVYLYSVKEFDTDLTRWNIRVNNNHGLSKHWSLKTNVEFISDEQLYYTYDKENWFIVKREINSSVSVSRDTQKNTLRVSYIRNDKYDDVKEKFVNSYYQTPVDFVLYPIDIGKFKISENVKIVPTFIESSTYYNVLSENNISIMYPLRLSKFVTLSPSTRWKALFEKSSAYEELRYYNVYSLVLPLRYTLGRYGSMDISHNYEIRSLDNSLNISTNVVNNNLSLRTDFYYKKMFAKISTSYDFLVKNALNWYNCFRPFNVNFGISYNYFGFNTNISYLLADNIIRDIQITADYALTNNSYVSIGYGRNYYQQELHFVTPSVSIYIPNNLQFKLRSALSVRKDKTEILNNNIELYKDLHCWEAKIFCNVRKTLSAKDSYIYELGGFIGLKFKPYVGTGGVISEVDKRYFPWRE